MAASPSAFETPQKKARLNIEKIFDESTQADGSSPRASNVNVEIDRLKKKREGLKKAAAKESKDLKLAERKRQRLMQKAKQLSANDLLEVYALRKDVQARKDAKKEP